MNGRRSSIDLTADLAVGYKLDEASGTTVTDVLSTTNGTSSGVTVNQTGILGTCYQYTAANNYLYASSPSGISYPRTISMWINMTSLPSTAGRYFTLARELDGSFAENWFIRISSSDELLAGVKNTSGTYYYTYETTSGSMSTGQWYNIIYAIPSSGAAKLYINSVLQTGTSQTFSGTHTTSNYQWSIGNAKLGSNAIAGYVDDVYEWSKELSQSEIDYLYNSGTGRSYPF